MSLSLSLFVYMVGAGLLYSRASVLILINVNEIMKDENGKLKNAKINKMKEECTIPRPSSTSFLSFLCFLYRDCVLVYV